MIQLAGVQRGGDRRWPTKKQNCLLANAKRNLCYHQRYASPLHIWCWAIQSS